MSIPYWNKNRVGQRKANAVYYFPILVGGGNRNDNTDIIWYGIFNAVAFDRIISTCSDIFNA